MTKDSYYQFWSAMQRRSQELLWESVIEPTERQLPALIARSRKLSKKALARGRKGTLRLDPGAGGAEVPHRRGHSPAARRLSHRLHLDDVAAGVVYDKGINLYMGDALGPENDLTGNSLLAYIQEKHPDFRPKRILDMGCAIGNSTLVWARAFPDAETHGIDVGAPVVRYAHARAQALGVPAHFSQQNAEATDFEAGSFDLVISHIMLHETSKSALVRILKECRRLLRPRRPDAASRDPARQDGDREVHAQLGELQQQRDLLPLHDRHRPAGRGPQGRLRCLPGPRRGIRRRRWTLRR